MVHDVHVSVDRLSSLSAFNTSSSRYSSESKSMLLRGLEDLFTQLYSIIHSSPKVTGLSHDTIFGYNLPFTVTTCVYRPKQLIATALLTSPSYAL